MKLPLRINGVPSYSYLRPSDNAKVTYAAVVALLAFLQD
jgi:hypothetical protein